MTTAFSTKALEKIVRGVSCHRRIQILDLLESATEPMSLLDITKACRAKTQPISEHLRRLHAAELINKRMRGRFVLHAPTPRGRAFMSFLRSID